jgi:hypothetical protein
MIFYFQDKQDNFRKNVMIKEKNVFYILYDFFFKFT